MEGNSQHGSLFSRESYKGFSSVSECEIGISDGNREGGSRAFVDGLIKLEKGEELYENIKQWFFSVLGSSIEIQTKIEAIHRIDFGFSTARHARLHSFQCFEKALEKYANKRFAWFGASKDEIKKIISHGFGHSNQSDNTGSYGCGIYLSPFFSPIESVKLSIADADEVRHVLLCRVLLGRVELVRPGSIQFHPSSKEYDSGVDDLQSPKKYIVWNTHMNTRILPEYVISFKIPSCLIGDQKRQVPLTRQNVITFTMLIAALPKFLPSRTICLIEEHFREYRENKISEAEFTMRIRNIAGDELLKRVVDSLREKDQILPAVEGNTQHGRLSSVTTGFTVEFVSSSPVSECKKGDSGGNRKGESRALVDGLVKLDERESVFETIKWRFISDLGSLGPHTKIEAIHRNDFGFTFERQAKIVFFQNFAKSMEKYANMKQAWFGASKDVINIIISHGFGHSHQSDNPGFYGCGIYLSPDLSHVDSVKSSIADDDGVRYVLLCRVLLGRMELVRPGSGQCHPSSEEFDCGVDDLLAPKKYIVWSTHMNTPILPEYVISFRVPSFLIEKPLRPFDHDPLGLKYDLTHQQCILYLTYKVTSKPLPHNVPIVYCDPYNGKRLPVIISYLERRDALYMFATLRSTHKVGGRPIVNRRVGYGVWRSDSLDEEVIDEQGKCIGMARKFTYVKKGSKHHCRLFMTEYTLPAAGSVIPYDQLKDFILCQLTMGPRRNKSHHYEPINDVVSSAPSVSNVTAASVSNGTAVEQQSNPNHDVAAARLKPEDALATGDQKDKFHSGDRM